MVVSCKDTVCFSPPMVAPGPYACCAWSRGTAKLVVVVPCTSVGCALPGVHRCVSMRAQAPAGGRFYNRTHELECLKRLFSSEPVCTGITVIVCPVSCGKTALVKHFSEELEQPQRPLYLDCRQHAVNTPDSFASALLSTTV